MNKMILAISLLLITTTSQARSNSNPNEAADMGTITCLQNPEFSEIKEGAPLKAVFNQETKYGYGLTVTRENPTAEPTLLIKTRVQVHQEDVIIVFKEKKNVRFQIYADELDQAFLVTPQGPIYFNCEIGG